MSYRCKFCNSVVGHGIPMQKHIRYRQVQDTRCRVGVRSEIAEEIPGCAKCIESIGKGEKPLVKDTTYGKYRYVEYRKSQVETPKPIPIAKVTQPSKPVVPSKPLIAPKVSQPKIVKGNSHTKVNNKVNKNGKVYNNLGGTK